MGLQLKRTYTWLVSQFGIPECKKLNKESVQDHLHPGHIDKNDKREIFFFKKKGTILYYILGTKVKRYYWKQEILFTRT